jgi:hypothetical protein
MAWPRLLVPVCVLATLAFEPSARGAALSALRPEMQAIAEQWSRNAALGPTDPDLLRTATGLLDIAVDGIRRLPSGYLPAHAVDLTRGELLRLAGSNVRRGELACV